MGWVYVTAGTGFEKSITEAKTRSMPKYFAVLVIICPRSNICVPVAEYTRECVCKESEVEGNVRVTRPWRNECRRFAKK